MCSICAVALCSNMQLLFRLLGLLSRVDLSSLTDFAEVEVGVCVSRVSRVVFTVVVFICARWFTAGAGRWIGVAMYMFVCAVVWCVGMSSGSRWRCC
jgi:hypothetical protein